MRFELSATTGDQDFITAIADFRRYWQPNRNLTVALRGLHFGRYGTIQTLENQFNVIQPLFLGFESLIRGYSTESFQNEECLAGLDETGGNQQSSCPSYSRLFGNRLGVLNFEFRVPLLGVEEYGLFNFPYLPTELVLFQDAGVAWNADDPPVWEFSTSSVERVPVFSTGIGARFNVLGFLVVEAYYAKPWQRTIRAAHWGFQLAPGW